MATGRNELCPCGSGKKYKNCHEGKKSVSKGMIALLVGIALIAAAGAVATFLGRKDAPPRTGAAAASNPMNPGTPQPPGPVPPGKVWSVEHGQWHDINPAAGQQQTQIPVTTTPATAKAPVPQPPGPVPPGKVWSPEHGHWHDAPR